MADPLPRKLAAIIYADAVGYSRMAGVDEDETHRKLKESLDLIAKEVEACRGRIINYSGDAALAMFDAAVDAISCATAIQHGMAEVNHDVPDEKKIQFRIGVNLGDVIEDNGDIFGDGVNVAARLERLSEPGGICISDAVRTAIGQKIELDYEDLGPQDVKNIKEPIRAYKLTIPSEDGPVRNTSDAPVLDLPDKPSIAVIPFNNMSGDKDQEYFSDGITEDIITELSRFRSLFVVARNSSFQFRGESVDVQEVGRTLGVRFVLEGSVRRAGDRVRINAQLINAHTSEHIWADRYDGEIVDIFKVQDEISRSIVSTIAGRIEEYDARRVAAKATENLSAYESVLRGQELIQKYTREDYDNAYRYFEHAIALDPEFARAHGLLALVIILRFAWDMKRETIDHAIDVGNQALALDDHESKSHLALGVAHLFRFEYDKAEYHLSRAANLNPNDDLIMIENARYLMYVDEPLAGADLVRQAMRLNPFHPNWYWNILGRCLHTAKEYREAISALMRINTPQFWNHAYLAACHAELGQSHEAAVHSEAVLSLKPSFTISEFATALPYRDERVTHEFVDGLRKAGLPA